MKVSKNRLGLKELKVHELIVHNNSSEETKAATPGLQLYPLPG